MNGSGRCQQHGPAGVALRAHIASGSSRAILRHSRLVTWRPGGLSRARLAKRVPLAHDHGVADGPRRALPENLPAKREIYLIRSDGTSCTREFVQGRLSVGWVTLCVWVLGRRWAAVWGAGCGQSFSLHWHAYSYSNGFKLSAHHCFRWRPFILQTLLPAALPCLEGATQMVGCGSGKEVWGKLLIFL